MAKKPKKSKYEFVRPRSYAELQTIIYNHVQPWRTACDDKVKEVKKLQRQLAAAQGQIEKLKKAQLRSIARAWKAIPSPKRK